MAVQVLIMLHSLRVPVKATIEPLKAKQLQDTQELEARVYQALEATPEHGRKFAAAVRAVLTREDAWVDWKKNSKVPADAVPIGGKLPVSRHKHAVCL